MSRDTDNRCEWSDQPLSTSQSGAFGQSQPDRLRSHVHDRVADRRDPHQEDAQGERDVDRLTPIRLCVTSYPWSQPMKSGMSGTIDPATSAVIGNPSLPSGMTSAGWASEIGTGQGYGAQELACPKSASAFSCSRLSISAMSISWSSWPPISFRRPASSRILAPETPYRSAALPACLRNEL